MKSREFKEIIGPKAYRFLKIGFESYKDQFAEAVLLPPDVDPDFPSLVTAISSVPDNILEDEPEDKIPEWHERAEDQGDQDATDAS